MKKLLVGLTASIGVLIATGTAFSRTTTTVEKFSQQQLENDLGNAMSAPTAGTMTSRDGQLQIASGHENDNFMSDAGRYCMQQADAHHALGNQDFMVACLREILQNGLRVRR